MAIEPVDESQAKRTIAKTRTIGRTAALPGMWREESARLAVRYQEHTLAALLESAASDLEHAIEVDRASLLTVAEAAKQCGYSETHIRRLIAGGKLEDVGLEGSPRLRRRDLPCEAPDQPGTEALIDVFSDEVESLKDRYEGYRLARLLEVASEELTEAIAADRTAVFTVSESAELSRYSESHLRRLLSQKKLEDVGDPREPRIRRNDLPYDRNKWLKNEPPPWK